MRSRGTSAWICVQPQASGDEARLQACSLMYASYITADGSLLFYRDHLDPREKRYALDIIITVRRYPAEMQLFKGP